MTAANLPRPTHTILVVDDDGVNRELLRHTLAKEAYDVILAKDNAEAIEALQNRPVHLVLLDLMLPGRSGIDTCHDIRKKLKRRDLPVIMITGLSHRASRMLCIEAGADDFLNKPIELPDLFARIESQLKLREYYKLRGVHQEMRHESAVAAAQKSAPEAVRTSIERLTALLARRDAAGALTVPPDEVSAVIAQLAVLRAHANLPD